MFRKKNNSSESSDSSDGKTGAMPRHIAIIMDGNGRWAHRRGLPRIFGHRAGAKSVREMVRVCAELGVQALTLYAFSTENWSRPKTEVQALMRLLSTMLRKETDELNRNGVQLRAIGRIHELPETVQKDLARAAAALKHNDGLILNLALNYGGRQEMVDAVNAMLRDKIIKIDEESFKNYLYTKTIPDPDLVIRTSGEQRISNFLLYQAAYAEFYTTKILWPDFGKKALMEAIADFQNRERRFGHAIETIQHPTKL